MQDLVDYRAFMELQKDNFVLDPVAEKRKKIKEQIKRMAEMDKKQKQLKKQRRGR